MLINNLLYTSLSIVAPIVVFILLSFLVKKYFNNYYGVLIGLVLSAFIFGGLQAAAIKIYIIEEGENISVYRAFGSYNYAFENQQKAVIPNDRKLTHILNNSSKELVLEEVIYGNDGYYKNQAAWKELVHEIDSSYEDPSTKARVHFIKAYEYRAISIVKHEINFFFDQKIPEEMEEYGRRGNIKKYWLHYKD